MNIFSRFFLKVLEVILQLLHLQQDLTVSDFAILNRDFLREENPLILFFHFLFRTLQ